MEPITIRTLDEAIELLKAGIEITAHSYSFDDYDADSWVTIKDDRYDNELYLYKFQNDPRFEVVETLGKTGLSADYVIRLAK